MVSLTYYIPFISYIIPSHAIAAPIVLNPVGHSQRNDPGVLIQLPRWHGDGFISKHSLISKIIKMVLDFEVIMVLYASSIEYGFGRQDNCNIATK